ncbi:MAG: molybdopterin-binding protein [Thermoguttaceae bacterium]
MHAEIIAIGDEIVSGEHLDTNSPWLSLRLEELGVRVLYHSTAGDELEACEEVFRNAMGRADIVISSGGLGPTADDLTRDALARAAGRELVLYPQALEHIRSLFARRKREMPQQNEIQAMFPAGSRMIANPHGTAPGIDLELPRPGKRACRFFALPGVPAEMIEMWNSALASEIGTLAAGQKVIRRRKINCFGAGESQIEAMLPDLIRRGRTPTVGITAGKTTISLRITAEAPTEEECNALIEPTAATIRKCLGTLVFGEGDEELQHAVMRLLREENKTLATVEWGTAGLVADWLGEAAEDNQLQKKDLLDSISVKCPHPSPLPEGEGIHEIESKCFLGGLVVQNRESTGRLLGLDQILVGNPPASGEQASERMAAACRQRFRADYGLAVGCFPAFDPHDPKPVHLALADAKGVKIKPVAYAGHPAWLRIYIAKHALNMLRLAILDTIKA